MVCQMPGEPGGVRPLESQIVGVAGNEVAEASTTTMNCLDGSGWTRTGAVLKKQIAQS